MGSDESFSVFKNFLKSFFNFQNDSSLSFFFELLIVYRILELDSVFNS